MKSMTSTQEGKVDENTIHCDYICKDTKDKEKERREEEEEQERLIHILLSCCDESVR